MATERAPTSCCGAARAYNEEDELCPGGWYCVKCGEECPAPDPAIYRNKHGPRHDIFVHVEAAGTDQHGRILLQCLDHQPLSAAPGEMWINPKATGCTLKETGTQGEDLCTSRA